MSEIILAGNPVHIMVVDDTPVNLYLLEELLQAAGYRVAAFPNGDLALRAAARRPPDLILLDIMMPGMDGFEVCRLLKASEKLRNIPVIFISALHATGDKVRAFSRGGVDFITKPFQEAEILARVRAQAELLSLRRQLAEHNKKLEELVAEKTRDLVEANARLIESGRMKDDFLGMISHEIRTPANGILSIGELLFEECGQDELRSAFEESSQRLRDLIDDATLLGEIEKSGGGHAAATSIQGVFEDLSREFPNLQIEQESSIMEESFALGVERTVLMRGLKTMARIAATFSGSAPPLRISMDHNAGRLIASFDLTNLPLTSTQAGEFFRLESKVRSSSPAETLGLAPVVAEKFLRASGGRLRLLVRGEGGGTLVAEIPVAHSSSMVPGST
jgi:two-component system, sensor histidine kinase and response regulator